MTLLLVLFAMLGFVGFVCICVQFAYDVYVISKRAEAEWEATMKGYKQ